MLKPPVVLVGVGEMGGVFARGFLRLGHPVYPVTRHMSMEEMAREVADPALVMVAVAEADLKPVLHRIPPAWRDRLGLLQNELLPEDWRGFGTPTVISVWFEKKKGMDAKVIIPSPVHGPRAAIVAEALGSIDIPTHILTSEDDLLFELVLKNLYILTTNIASLRTGGTVGELWFEHPVFTREVANEVIDLQEALTGQTFDRERLIQAMLTAFEGDPEHRCMGRSAPQRLKRALKHAEEQGLALPTLTQIAVEHRID